MFLCHQLQNIEYSSEQLRQVVEEVLPENSSWGFGIRGG